jgi:outer membrane protein OmpA-like peptidoglycan-associated protein
LALRIKRRLTCLYCYHLSRLGNKVILKNIFFDTNKFELKAESKAELQKLVEFLQLNKTVRIEISGYTDDVGNQQANVVLSEKRANSVYQYLSANGITLPRLVYKGYGEAQPIAPNTSDDNRSFEPRTEFMIIAK